MCLLPYCTSLLFYALKLFTGKDLGNIYRYLDSKMIKAFREILGLANYLIGIRSTEDPIIF